MAKTGRRKGAGRPPAGVRPGERVSDYRRVTVRLPGGVRDELQAVASALRRPEWRIISDAIRAYAGTGPGPTDDERRAVRAVLKLHGGKS